MYLFCDYNCMKYQGGQKRTNPEICPQGLKTQQEENLKKKTKKP